MSVPIDEYPPFVAAGLLILRFGLDAEGVADTAIRVAEVNGEGDQIVHWREVRRCIDDLRQHAGKPDDAPSQNNN